MSPSCSNRTNHSNKFETLKSRGTNTLGSATLHTSVVADVVDDLGLLLATAGAGLLLDGSRGAPGRLAALLPLRNNLEQLGRLVVLEDTVRHAPSDTTVRREETCLIRYIHLTGSGIISENEMDAPSTYIHQRMPGWPVVTPAQAST